MYVLGALAVSSTKVLQPTGDVSAMSEELASLRADLAAAEASAQHWRQEAGRLSCEQHGVGPTGGYCLTHEDVTPNSKAGNACLPEGIANTMWSMASMVCSPTQDPV